MSRFQSTKVFDGFSTVFRQWRAFHSHCRYLHGYSLSFEVWFEGPLDCRGWVQDYGSFKTNGVKKTLEYWFDHTTIVAQDDPHLKLLKFSDKDKIAQVRIVPNVGSERFAELVYVLVNAAVEKESGGRVSVVKVECSEHSKNSAIFEGESSLQAKYCKQCGIWKLSTDYHPSRGECKLCSKEKYKNSPEKRQKALDRAKKRYELSREEVIETGKRWAQQNGYRSSSIAKKSSRKQYQSIVGKLKHNTRSIIHNSLVKQEGLKYGRTRELLGCDFETLKLHLESQFKEGMTWDNYGKWHVDHKKPCASFDLTNPEQQFECFHYTNLQPLWAVDNIEKSSIYEGIKYYHK